jgi:cytochrome P450
MVLYSPYLTHRDPASWTDPYAFRPERFDDGIAAWSYLPLSAGRRTCLGAHPGPIDAHDGTGVDGWT